MNGATCASSNAFPWNRKRSGNHFSDIGLDKQHSNSLYLLGPVGVEIATTRHGVVPVDIGRYPMRIMHDIATNEIVLRILGKRSAVEVGPWNGLENMKAPWWTKNGKTILEPDGLIRFQQGWQGRGRQRLPWSITMKTGRPAPPRRSRNMKRPYMEGNWRDQWEVETFAPSAGGLQKPSWELDIRTQPRVTKA